MKFDINKILEVSKKNWVSISLGVVMLIALISVFTFVSSQQADLQKSLNDRKQVYDDLNKLLTAQRHQPVVSPDPDAVPPDLKQFPNQRIIAAGEAAIKRVQDQSQQLKNLAAGMNVHAELVPGALPIVRDKFQFQQIYLQQFSTVIPRVLQSATPPTEEEIKNRGDAEEAQLTKDQPHTSTGEIYNKEALQQRIAQMRAELPEQMRQEAATKHRMYMATNALSIHPALAGGTGVTVAPNDEQIWLAQVGLWVQQDIVTAIGKLNAGSKQVEQSPVKQLVQVYVSPDRDLYAIPGANPGAAASATPGAPAASAVAANSDTDPLPKDFSVSPTGHVCNGIFDVVHFTLVLNVQAADVEKVIDELERNRLVTVYQTEIQAINSVAMQQQGFYFGKNPVVTLTIKGEEILMRDWTRKLMPPVIKAFLNVDQQPAAPTGDQPTASAG